LVKQNSWVISKERRFISLIIWGVWEFDNDTCSALVRGPLSARWPHGRRVCERERSHGGRGGQRVRLHLASQLTLAERNLLLEICLTSSKDSGLNDLIALH
jgi:hypothetical protein